MNLKSRSITAIIIGIVLVTAAILVWAQKTGKITIFGEEAVITQSYILNVPGWGSGDANIDQTQLQNGKIQLKQELATTDKSYTQTRSRLNDYKESMDNCLEIKQERNTRTGQLQEETLMLKNQASFGANYCKTGVYTSKLIGGGEVKQFYNFDRATATNTTNDPDNPAVTDFPDDGSEWQFPPETYINYQILDGVTNTVLAQTQNTSTQRGQDWLDLNSIKTSNGTIKVKITLSGNGQWTPRTRGFVVNYGINTLTGYVSSGVYTSNIVGDNNTKKWLSFDRATADNTGITGYGAGQDLPEGTQVQYGVFEADTNKPLKYSNGWTNYIDLADVIAKRIYVKIVLSTENKSITPYTYGFKVTYQTSGPNQPPPNVEGFSAKANDNDCTKATASWTAPAVSDLSHYIIKYSDQNQEPTSGGIQVNAPATTYEFSGLAGSKQYYAWIKAVNTGGLSSVQSATASFTTKVCPIANLPVITAFNANPLTITSGQSSSLAWTITGADSAKIDPGVGPVDKSSSGTNPKSVSPTQTTTYTLTATNSVGSKTAQVTLTVNTPPVDKPIITKFTADPLTVKKGGDSKLVWEITNATSASIDQNIGSVDKTKGEKIVTLTEEKEYTLTATNSAESVTAKVKITLTGDNQAPTAPTNLTGTPVGNNGINLTWTASTDNVGVTGYAIYDATNDQMIGTSVDNKFFVSGLKCSSTYKFYVRAHDSSGNWSEKSNTVEVKTGACSGVVGESVPSGSAGIPAKLASTTKLVSTGAALWFNVLVALVLAGGIGYFLLRRKSNS